MLLGVLLTLLAQQAVSWAASQVQARPDFVRRAAYGSGYDLGLQLWRDQRRFTEDLDGACRVAAEARYGEGGDQLYQTQIAFDRGCSDAVSGRPEDAGSMTGSMMTD